MNSDLELMVNEDMIKNGYDPTNKEDVSAYWEELLEDD